MIRQLAQCPYCQQCEVALTDSPEITFNPDGARQEPCAHLVWVDGGYSQWELSALPGRKTRIPRMVGSTEFEWLHPALGGGVEPDRLRAYLKEWVSSGPGWEFAPPSEHAVCPISRDQTVRGPDGRDHPSWSVEGAAVFARSAAAVVAEIPNGMARQAAVWPEPPGLSFR